MAPLLSVARVPHGRHLGGGAPHHEGHWQALHQVRPCKDADLACDGPASSGGQRSRCHLGGYAHHHINVCKRYTKCALEEVQGQHVLALLAGRPFQGGCLGGHAPGYEGHQQALL